MASVLKIEEYALHRNPMRLITVYMYILYIEPVHYHHIADCEYKYEEMEGEMKAKLMALADNACTYIHGQRWVNILI